MTQRAPIRRFCLTTLFASLLLSGAAAQAKEWKSITIATEGSYEPWNLTLPGGKLGGFEPELMEDLCKRMGVQCKLVVQNWDGMIAGLNAGKYDVIMDAIVITPDRKKKWSTSPRRTPLRPPPLLPAKIIRCCRPIATSLSCMMTRPRSTRRSPRLKRR